MSEVTLIKCDVCKATIDSRDHNHKEPQKMQMLRNFDSCDGKIFYKHFVIDSIHICRSCFEETMKSGKYLIDERVQGYGDIKLQKNT